MDDIEIAYVLEVCNWLSKENKLEGVDQYIQILESVYKRIAEEGESKSDVVSTILELNQLPGARDIIYVAGFREKSTDKISYYYIPHFHLSDYTKEKDNYAKLLNPYHKPLASTCIGGILIEQLALILGIK